MTVYYLLFAIPFLLNILYAIKKDREIKEKVIFTFFYILLTILSCRAETNGRDLLAYKNIFIDITNSNIRLLIFSDTELGFVLYVKLITLFTKNYNIFLAITSFVCIFPLMLLYTENKTKALYIDKTEKVDKFPFLTVVLFLITDTFFMLFSGLRQAIAISICVIAYKFIKERKPIHFIFCVVAAFMFHKSAIVFMVFYPLYYFNVKSKQLLFIVPLFIYVFIFKEQIFIGVMELLKSVYGSYAKIEHTGAYAMALLYAIFIVFVYVVGDESKLDDEAKGIRTILLLMLGIQIFASVSNVINRLNMYFSVYIPILIPKIIQNSKEKYKKLSKLGVIVMIVVFVSWWFYRAYTDSTWVADMFPWIPFFNQ